MSTVITSKYPVQIQGDNTDANDTFVCCMVHVFDLNSERNAIAALTKQYLHVVAWDVAGLLIYEYDNR